MSIEQSNLTFEKARKSGDSLSKIEREIRQAEIKNKAKEDLSSLRNSISDELITKLYGEGMKVVSGDALHHINHITLKRLHIKWYDGVLDKRDDANHIWPGDTIKIEGNKAFRYHNGKKTEIGEVEKKKEDSAVAKAPKKKQGTPPLNPQNPSNGEKKQTPPKPPAKGEAEEQTPPPAADGEVAVNPTINENIGNKWETVGYSLNGENYIIGEDGEPKIITYEQLTPKTKESLKNYKELLIIVENMNLLLSAMTQDGRDVSLVQKYIKESIGSFDPLNINKTSSVIKTTIMQYFRGLDIDNKEEIDLKDRVSTLNYIRNEFDNYELVRKNIIEKNFNSLTKVSNEELQNFIENPTVDQEKIKTILGKEEYLNFKKSIIDKKAEAEKYFVSYEEELDKKLPGVNKNDIKQIIINSFVGTFAKIKISETFIEKNQSTYMGGYNGNNKELELFSDIQGIGALDLSDKNSNIGWEGFKLIATEVLAIAAGTITLGAGTLLINGFVYGNRVFKGIKYLKNIGDVANKGIKGENLLRKGQIIGSNIGMGAIEGGTFYAGYGAMQSGIERKNMYSIEGLGESVAFMSAFRTLNIFYKSFGLKFDATKSLKGQKLKLGANLVGDGITFSVLGLGFQGVLLEPGEWTAETILQAFIMAAAFRGAGVAIKRMRFKQKGEKVIAEKLKEETSETSNSSSKDTNKPGKQEPQERILIRGSSINKEAGKIEKNRAENNGHLTGKYQKYDKQYQKLYKKLDEEGLKGQARKERIEELDQKIAKKEANQSQLETSKTSNISTSEKSNDGNTKNTKKTKAETTKEKSTVTETTKTETTITSEIQSRISKIKEIIKNSPLSFINREFRSFFNKHDFEKSSLLLGKSKTITKEGNYFKVNNGDINYTQKQLFKEIITTKHKRNKLISIAEKNIKNEEISISLGKPWYPFGRAKIKIENGKLKKFNLKEKKYEDMKPTKVKSFLKENPKIMEEIIKKQIDKVRLETLNWEGIGTGSKELLWKTLKNSIFSKGHLKIIGFSSAFTIYDILVNEEKNKDKLLNEALLSFALSYIPMATLGILVIGKRAFQYGGGKIIDLGVKPIWNSKVVQHIVNNVGKYTIGGLTTVAGIKFYTAEDEK